MQSLLIDTSLLVLWVVGLTDRQAIGKHKRTKEFSPGDFDILTNALASYQVLWVTTNCITETSNLLKQTHQSASIAFHKVLAAVISKARESHHASGSLLQDNRAFRLGISDAGIFRKSRHVSNTLTADFDLYRELTRSGRRAINFNHLRTF